MLLIHSELFFYHSAQRNIKPYYISTELFLLTLLMLVKVIGPRNNKQTKPTFSHCYFSFCYKDVVHYEYAPEGETVTRPYYLGILHHFHVL